LDFFNQTEDHGCEDQNCRIIGKECTCYRSHDEEISKEFKAITVCCFGYPPSEELEESGFLSYESNGHEAHDGEYREGKKLERVDQHWFGKKTDHRGYNCTNDRRASWFDPNATDGRP
jgi:hypothetical protein